MTKKILCGLIILTAATFSAFYLVTQMYAIATLSFALGLIWLILEMTEKDALAYVFFLFFGGLAIIGALNNIPISISLVGLSSALAAWDLSRFKARITSVMGRAIEPLSEKAHLQKLAAAIGSGCIIAVSFSFIRISISFATLALIVLLAVVGFRKSIVSLLSTGKSA